MNDYTFYVTVGDYGLPHIDFYPHGSRKLMRECGVTERSRPIELTQDDVTVHVYPLPCPMGTRDALCVVAWVSNSDPRGADDVAAVVLTALPQVTDLGDWNPNEEVED